MRSLVVAIAVALSLGAYGCGRGTLESERPNVLLISVDTLRADHLGSYGFAYETSANIDGLAATGSCSIGPSRRRRPRRHHTRRSSVGKRLATHDAARGLPAAPLGRERAIELVQGRRCLHHGVLLGEIPRRIVRLPRDEPGYRPGERHRHKRFKRALRSEYVRL